MTHILYRKLEWSKMKSTPALVFQGAGSTQNPDRKRFEYRQVGGTSQNSSSTTALDLQHAANVAA